MLVEWSTPSSIFSAVESESQKVHHKFDDIRQRLNATDMQMVIRTAVRNGAREVFYHASHQQMFAKELQTLKERKEVAL